LIQLCEGCRFYSRSEIGDEANKLHCHALLCFHHRTILHINFDLIKKDFGTFSGLGNGWYFNSQLCRKAEFDMQKYIDKYVKKKQGIVLW
jgi:hypothetical protein